MKRNVLEVPKNDVWYCHFFFLGLCVIKITYREKINLAENRDINSKLKKNRDSYFSRNCAGLMEMTCAGMPLVHPWLGCFMPPVELI